MKFTDLEKTYYDKYGLETKLLGSISNNSVSTKFHAEIRSNFQTKIGLSLLRQIKRICNIRLKIW